MKNISFTGVVKAVVVIMFIVHILAEHIIHSDVIENIASCIVAAGFVILLIEDSKNGKEKKK